MSQQRRTEPDVLRDLGNGLILRRARSEDRESVAAFHANTLLALDETPPLERLQFWILDLMSGQHPTVQPGDFTLVEETATGKIVSSLALISQTWTYEGIPFKVGQPDIVSTDPAFRRRGLVRAQFDEIHRWSSERGELVQVIPGIPWYYRQFGYEMALSLDAKRVAFKARVPKLKAGDSEPYIFRRATTDDLAFVMEVYQQAMARSVVAFPHGEPLWRYEIEGRSEKSGFRSELRVVETSESNPKPVALVIHSQRLWGSGRLGVRLYEVKPGVPFLAVTPTVMRYLDRTGDEYAKRDGEDFGAISFDLGEQHPVYDTVRDRLAQAGLPYAWYIRVPDLPAFLSQIAPALERRLEASAQAGYTGDLTLSFYGSGLYLRFHAGSIAVEGWRPQHIEEGNAAFPGLTFLQLLFGYRSLDELRHAFPDCWTATDDARALLPILFPKKASHVWPGG